jgi:hypothetical protein
MRQQQSVLKDIQHGVVVAEETAFDLDSLLPGGYIEAPRRGTMVPWQYRAY